MLLAESAILLHLETIGVILLVLHGVVVSLLALGTSHSDFHAHIRHLLKNLPPCMAVAIIDLANTKLLRYSSTEEKGAKKYPFSQVALS